MDILELKYLQNRLNAEKIISTIGLDQTISLDESRASLLSNSFNALALHLLNENKFQDSLECLRKSEDISSNYPPLRASTYNIIAVFYRKQGKYSTSLKYIERSLSIFPTGEAYLNLSSVLSFQLKNEKALELAMHAIIFLQDEIFEEFFEGKKINELKLENLAAAYYNLAVQLEFLKRADEANSYYKKAVQFSDKYLNDNNIVKEILKQIYDKIITGSLRKYEFHRNIKTPTIKKRVVIKGSSRSPISKTSSSSGKKLHSVEKGQTKLVGPSLSHRKFVKTGLTKAKLIESNIPAPDKEDSSEEELVKKLASTQTFAINHEDKERHEISLKNKFEIEKNHARHSRKQESEKKRKEHRLENNEIKVNQEEVANQIDIQSDDNKEHDIDKSCNDSKIKEYKDIESKEEEKISDVGYTEAGDNINKEDNEENNFENEIDNYDEDKIEKEIENHQQAYSGSELLKDDEKKEIEIEQNKIENLELDIRENQIPSNPNNSPIQKNLYKSSLYEIDKFENIKHLQSNNENAEMIIKEENREITESSGLKEFHRLESFKEAILEEKNSDFEKSQESQNASKSISRDNSLDNSKKSLVDKNSEVDKNNEDLLKEKSLIIEEENEKIMKGEKEIMEENSEAVEDKDINEEEIKETNEENKRIHDALHNSDENNEEINNLNQSPQELDSISNPTLLNHLSSDIPL